MRWYHHIIMWILLPFIAIYIGIGELVIMAKRSGIFPRKCGTPDCPNVSHYYLCRDCRNRKLNVMLTQKSESHTDS